MFYSPVTFVFLILESSHQIDSRHKDAGRIPQHSGKLSAGHRATIRCKFDIRVQLDLLIETAGTMLLDGCRMRSDKPHSRTPIIVRFWRTSLTVFQGVSVLSRRFSSQGDFFRALLVLGTSDCAPDLESLVWPLFQSAMVVGQPQRN